MTFFLVTLRKLAGRNAAFALIMTFPAILVIIKCGQNGFLTAGLIGLFLTLFIRGSTFAGIPLGLLVIKPHLALGIGLLALATGRWRVLAVAAVTAMLSAALATVIFGFNVWAAFDGAVKEAWILLEAGYFPLYRMASIYAAVRSMGASAEVAFAIHLVIAGLACIGIVVISRTCRDIRLVCGVTAFLSIFISPYFYDYDLAILALALGLVADRLDAALRHSTQWWMLILAWLICGYGLIVSVVLGSSASTTASDTATMIATPAGILLLLLGIFAFRQAKR